MPKLVATFAPILGRLLIPFARRFIAGTTLDNAILVIKQLHSAGFLTTLNELGEDVHDEPSAILSRDRYIRVINRLADENINSEVSIKLTHLGLDIDYALCKKNVIVLCEAAARRCISLRIDIEGSGTTSATYDIVHEARSLGFPIGAAVQAMLKRTPKDVARLLEDNVSIRLCKGAYKEPHEIAYKDMAEIRRQFDALMKRLFMSHLYHGIATHDKVLIDAAKEFVNRNNVSKDAFEFQMLYGIKPSYQRQLKVEGWRLRIYVPFGSHWLPYVIRRLRERKENVIFIMKAFFGL